MYHTFGLPGVVVRSGRRYLFDLLALRSNFFLSPPKIFPSPLQIFLSPLKIFLSPPLPPPPKGAGEAKSVIRIAFLWKGRGRGFIKNLGWTQENLGWTQKNFESWGQEVGKDNDGRISLPPWPKACVNLCMHGGPF